MIIGSTFSQSVQNQPTMTVRQFNAFSNQSRLNSLNQTKVDKQEQKLAQQQERHEIRTARANAIWNGIRFVLLFLLNGVLLLIGLGCTGLLAFYIVRLFRKSTADYFIWREQADHELRLEREMTKRIKYQFAPNKGVFDGLRLSGNLTFNPNNSVTDNHSSSLTNRLPKQSDFQLEKHSYSGIENADFSPVIKQLTPTLNEALNDIKKKKTLVLGYDENNQPVWGEANKTFSISYAGKSGSGKTGTCLYSVLSFLAIYPDTQIAILDPHKGNPESLETNLQALELSYFCPPSSDETEEVLAFCGLIINEFKARKTLGDCSDLPYILVIVDELPALFHGWNSDEISQAVKELCQCLGQQTRKYKMLGMGIAQAWDAANANGLKKVFTSSYTCRTSQEDFRNQTGTLAARAKTLPIPVDELRTGQSYLKNTAGDLMLLNIPHVQKNDVELFAQSLFSSGLQSDYRKLSGNEENAPIVFMKNQPESSLQSQINQDEYVTDANLTTQELGIIKLFKNGKTIQEIVREVFDVKSGAKYTRYVNEVQKLLREQLK